MGDLVARSLNMSNTLAGGAWVNSCFRRQGGRQIASEMIRDAVAATRWNWPEVPELGMISFVDSSKVRVKEMVGRCYLEAGFRHVGFTKSGLHAFQLLAGEMPDAQEPANKVEIPLDKIL